MASLPGLEIDPSSVETNIVNVRTAPDVVSAEEFEAAMAERGVLFHAIAAREARMVTHLDVTRSDILWALDQMGGFLAS